MRSFLRHTTIYVFALVFLLPMFPRLRDWQGLLDSSDLLGWLGGLVGATAYLGAVRLAVVPTLKRLKAESENPAALPAAALKAKASLESRRITLGFVALAELLFVFACIFVLGTWALSRGVDPTDYFIASARWMTGFGAAILLILHIGLAARQIHFAVK